MASNRNSSSLATILVDVGAVEALMQPQNPGPAYVFAVDGILQTVFIVFGCIANLATIPVYARPQVWSYINYYFVALAIADTTLLLSYFGAMSLWVIVHNGFTYSYGPHVRYVQAGFILCHVSNTATIWFAMLLTVERYVAICHPGLNFGSNRDRRIRIVIVMATLLAVAYNSVKMFEFELAEVTTAEFLAPTLEALKEHLSPNVSLVVENGTIAVLLRSAMYASAGFETYRIIGRVVCDAVVPVLLIAILTTKMCFLWKNNPSIPKLMKSQPKPKLMFREAKPLMENAATGDVQQAGTAPPPVKTKPPLRTRAPSLKRLPTIASSLYLTEAICSPRAVISRQVSMCAPNRLNFTLRVLLVKFVISHTLPAVTTIVELCNEEHLRSDVMVILTMVANLLVVINSATNCVVTVVFGDQFWREMKRFYIELWQKVTCQSRGAAPQYDIMVSVKKNGAGAAPKQARIATDSTHL